MLIREKCTWIAAATLLTASAALIASYPQAASADVRASIKNLDNKTYRLTVVEGEKTREIKLQPLQEIRGICDSVCLLSVDDDPDPYELVANDRVEIEGGEVLYQSDDTEEQTSDETVTPDDPQTEGDTSTDESASESDTSDE